MLEEPRGGGGQREVRRARPWLWQRGRRSPGSKQQMWWDSEPAWQHNPKSLGFIGGSSCPKMSGEEAAGSKGGPREATPRVSALGKKPEAKPSAGCWTPGAPELIQRPPKSSPGDVIARGRWSAPLRPQAYAGLSFLAASNFHPWFKLSWPHPCNSRWGQHSGRKNWGRGTKNRVRGLWPVSELL